MGKHQPSNRTKALIKEYGAGGYEIVIGNDWQLSRRPKWAGYECVRLCQTNSKRHGRCIYTVWAVRVAEGEPAR